MPKEHTAHVMLQEGMRFSGAAGSGYTVALNDTAGEGGLTPVEMVLIGLAGCCAMDVIAILRKQRQPVRGLEVRARGECRDEPPRIFTTIAVEFLVYGADVRPAAVERAIELSAARYCPVWAMLQPSVAISSSFQVLE